MRDFAERNTTLLLTRRVSEARTAVPRLRVGLVSYSFDFQHGKQIMKPDPEQKLPVTGDAVPNVPVFSCIIYIRQNEDRTVSGRVANLAGLSSSGASERDVLSRLSREFKTQVMGLHQDGKEIPWIDPPTPAESDERVRSIPVHL